VTPPRLADYLLWPLRPTPLLLILIFTLGLLLANAAGLIGIPLAIILVSWFFKYCFVFFDALVAGEEQPPVLSAEMVNPIDEQRPLAQALALAVAASLLAWLQARAGRPAFVLGSLLLLAVLPANVALLGISGNPFHAASPLAQLRLIRGLGWRYLWLVLAIILCGASLYGLWHRGLPLALLLAGTQLAFLVSFTLLGAVLHANRVLLGLETRTRTERRDERERREQRARRRHMLDDAYAQLRLRRIEAAWQEIERWLAHECTKDTAASECGVLLEAVSSWDDATLGDRLANQCLALLLAHGETGRALEVLEKRLAVSRSFAPAPAALARRLAELADLAGKRALGRGLRSRLSS